MSGASIGTIAGAFVGAIVGYVAGGFTPTFVYAGMSLGATVGGAVGGAVDAQSKPPLAGPRLNDLTVQTATYGAFIPRGYGVMAYFGNMFWLKDGQLTEVVTETTSGGKGGMMGMGGGADTTSYSYFATFALGICEGPITGVRRIWIGPKLVYDIRSTDHEVLEASTIFESFFKIYYGTTDQQPDPIMQASLGAANVPGYTGLAYLVFYDLPLADYGNSLIAAQIKVEVVVLGETLSNVLDLESASFQDTYYRSLAINGNYAYIIGSLSATLNIFDITDKANPVYIGGDASTWDAPFDPVTITADFQYIYCAGLFNQSSQYGIIIMDISNPLSPVKVASQLIGSPSVGCIQVEGIYIYLIRPDADTFDAFKFDRVTDPGNFTITALGSSATGADPVSMVISNSVGFVVCETDSVLQTFNIDPFNPIMLGSVATGASPKSVSVSGNYAYVVTTAATNLEIFDISDANSPVLVTSIETSAVTSGNYNVDVSGHFVYVISYTDNTLDIFDVSDADNPFLILTSTGPVVSGDLPSWVVANGNYIYLIVGFGTDTRFRILFFADNSMTDFGGGVPLSTIVSAESLLSNLLTASDIDVTLLTSMVRGYKITAMGAIRAGIEPLRAAWPFDAVQHGYQIKFIPRGTASVATIDSELLDARAAGAEPGILITNSREMDAQLPKKVSLKYFDYEREYDNGEQYAERINTDAVNITEIEFAISLNANEAIQKANILLYLYWMERYDVAFRLPPEYSYLEPADVITITSDDATYLLRLTTISYNSDGRLECRAKYHVSAIYISDAVGESGQFTGQTLRLPGVTIYELLDIPLIQDVYDTSGFPLAMTGTSTTWTGGVLYQSSDGAQTWSALQSVQPPGATLGYATDALLEHIGTVLDKTGVLTIIMRQGTLSSVTEAQMFTGQNWFAYGWDARWEIIGVQNCVLQGDGSYILTDFLRGQMGTEWATGLHVAGDKFVHLSSTELAFVAVSQASIGVEKIYRGISFGASIDSDVNRAFSYDGVNLECLSPCHFTGSRHPSTNDWTLVWTRRTRFAGWRDYIDAILGESSESYEIDIFSSSTYATLKRTLTATTGTVEYTSAQQVTDFGAVQNSLYVKVYQMSAIVGRGYPSSNLIFYPGDYTVLMLHCNGTNGSTSFPDSSAITKTVTPTNATVSTTQSKFGGASCVIGASGTYLTVTDNAEFDLGTADFTIEAQVYITSFSPTLQTVLNIGSYASGIMVRLQATTFDIYILNNPIPFAATISTGTWHHIELTRQAGTLRAFLDGVQAGTDQTATYDIPNNAIIIGKSQHDSSEYVNGYIDEVRILKGLAKHTADFTPPAAEY